MISFHRRLVRTAVYSWVVLGTTIVMIQGEEQPQLPPLMGYTSTTDVTYQSTIDVDQQQIENLLSQITGSTSNKQQDRSYIDQAYAIYTQRLRTLSSADGTAFRKPSNTNEFLSFFTLYIDYMGDSDFAHDFITSGFNDTATTSGYSGNFKLVEYNLPGGLQNVIQLGTIILTLVQYIIRNLDVAIEECIICTNTGDTTSDCGVSLIDEAAAYYVGSLQSTLSNTYEGYVLFGAADRLCQIFNTCDGTLTFSDTIATSRQSSETDGTVTTSRVNMVVLQQLTNLQSNIQSRLCSADTVGTTMMLRNTIVSQLFVPIIQGLIRSVHYTQQSVVSDFCNADATMYAAAILPLIYNCTGNDDAESLFDQTKPNRDVTTNATLINEILLRNYDCFGISSVNDIGTFNPDIMVEWGRCGQPTPAPVVPKPVTPPTSAPSSATVVASTAPTMVPVTIPSQPTTPASPTTSSGRTVAHGTNWITTIIVMAMAASYFL